MASSKHLDGAKAECRVRRLLVYAIAVCSCTAAIGQVGTGIYGQPGVGGGSGTSIGGSLSGASPLGAPTDAASQNNASSAGAAPGPVATGRQGLIVEPRIEVIETYTNNSALSTQTRQSDFITEVIPGIRVSSNGGRVRGLFDYSLLGIVYARGTADNTIQHRLNGFGSIEAVNNWAFIDVAGSVSRQTISAFGTQTTDTSRSNPNLTNVSTLSVSPYLRGRFQDAADYQLRYRRTISNAGADNVSDVSLSDWLARISEEYTDRRFGWMVQAERNNIDYSDARDVESDRFRGVLTYIATPQLRLFVSGGKEANNYLSLEKESYTDSGFGFRWRPSERTLVEAERERRFFGTGHRVTFDHRTSRSAWRFSDTKDTYVSRALEGLGTQGSLFELLFNQFASIEPDPVRRTQLVNNFLRANGLDANATPGTGFLSSSITLQRLQQLSFSLFGLRDTVTFIGNRSESRRLDGLTVVSDDFANTDVIRQRGFGVAYAHRLTPTSGINFFALRQKSKGTLAFLESTNTTYSVNYTNRLGPKTDFSLGARRTQFDSGSGSYNELAVFGRMTVRF